MIQIATYCIRLEYYPTYFRHAVTVVLKKPHKNYLKAKFYRLIFLLNTLDKIVETAVANRIRAILKKNEKLPDTQIKVKKNRSTISALKLLTKQIKTV